MVAMPSTYILASVIKGMKFSCVETTQIFIKIVNMEKEFSIRLDLENSFYDIIIISIHSLSLTM